MRTHERATPPAKPRPERIGARVTPDVMRTLTRAAALSGATLNQFLVQSALKEAQAVLDREQAIRLSERDSTRLLDLLSAPPKANPALARARRRYRQARRSDADHAFDWRP
jgi:uncharacterized protein (DUF1778 family)